jgi:hypothetical protein
VTVEAGVGVEAGDTNSARLSPRFGVEVGVEAVTSSALFTSSSGVQA